jgi:mRNA-degrading endonuclease RelE of RelBE toxin-antitoxin system
MAKKPAITQQVIVLSAKPLDDDEADYLISRERGLTHQATSFEHFLKRRPRDAKGVDKAVLPWKSQLLSGAEKEYDALRDSVRATAMAFMRGLAEDPFPTGALPLGKHRGHYRAPFYRDQYRMIYKVSKSQRAVVITRIRRKDEKTYAGKEQAPPAI